VARLRTFAKPGHANGANSILCTAAGRLPHADHKLETKVLPQSIERTGVWACTCPTPGDDHGHDQRIEKKIWQRWSSSSTSWLSFSGLLHLDI
jgi:hypothetical protein